MDATSSGSPSGARRPPRAPKRERADHTLPNLPLTVRAITWNLGGSPISPEDDLSTFLLGSRLPGTKPGAKDHHPDICVIGFQELVELNSRNIFWASEKEELSTQALLDTRIAEELDRSGTKYVKVAGLGMVGLYLSVYIRKPLAEKVNDVAIDRVKTGIFHLAGNKGAVCVRFDVEGVSFCFLNLHLAAGQENQAARNQDIDDALKYCFQEVGAYGTLRAQTEQFHRQSAFLASEHHLTVVLGDFNFRLDLPDDMLYMQKPEGFVLQGDPLSWLEWDPWRMGVVTGLDDFVEGEIHFNPTYKYKKGSDELDTKRWPAWCDRVLYKAMPILLIKLVEYTCLTQLKYTSDHRPVAATLEVHNKVRKPQAETPARRRSWLYTLSASFAKLGETFDQKRKNLSRRVGGNHIASVLPVRYCNSCLAFAAAVPRCLGSTCWRIVHKKDGTSRMKNALARRVITITPRTSVSNVGRSGDGSGEGEPLREQRRDPPSHTQSPQPLPQTTQMMQTPLQGRRPSKGGSSTPAPSGRPTPAQTPSQTPKQTPGSLRQRYLPQSRPKPKRRPSMEEEPSKSWLSRGGLWMKRESTDKPSSVADSSRK